MTWSATEWRMRMAWVAAGSMLMYCQVMAADANKQFWQSRMPEGAGKALTVQLCGSCHNLEKVVVSRKTPDEWERTVMDMTRRGAQIFPDEAEQITKYLADNFQAGKPPFK